MPTVQVPPFSTIKYTIDPERTTYSNSSLQMDEAMKHPKGVASKATNRISMSKKQMDNGSSWGPLRSLFSYRYRQELKRKSNNKKKNWKKIGCSGSLCRMRDSSSVINPAAVVTCSEANSKMASGSSCNSSSRSLKAPSDGITGAISTSFSSNSSSSVTATSSSPSSSLEGSFGAMHLRGVSGCYECRDIFMTPDDLELHQIQRHAGTLESFSRYILQF